MVFKSKMWYMYGLVLVGFMFEKVYLWRPSEIVQESLMTTTELVEKHGYKTETHFVKTEDGYILQMHRIVRSPMYHGKPDNVIFAMHGLFSSSADYTLFGPNISLAYMLADNGYDVWMGNARGNRYSRNHTTLSTRNSKFWRFSWHEIGVYDLPAFIDYVLKQTNRKSLTYIGYSQGTTAFFVMCSERPEYMKKINHMQALSPVVFLKNTKSRLVRLGVLYTSYFDLWYKIRGPYEFLPNTILTKTFGQVSCNDKTLLNIICTTVIFELCGYDLPQLNLTKLPIFFGHIPAGASNMNVIHYGQSVETGDFRKFDYGRKQNLKEYGTIVPPKYNLKKITVPIAMHYSDNDAVSHPDDVMRLKNILPNVIGLYKPEWKGFNHVDYLYANDAKKYMHHTILDILKRYSN